MPTIPPSCQTGCARTLGLLFAILLLAHSAIAAAQEGPRRTVVLDVEDGDSQALRDSVAQIEAVEVKDQKWFLRQIRKRDVRAHKIMKRPADLRFVMSGSDIDYVIAVLLEGGSYEGAVYDASGEQVHRFSLSGGQFGTDEAARVRSEFENVLGLGFEMGEEVSSEDPEPAPAPAADAVTTEETDSAPPPPPGDDPWLLIEPTARLFKRDLSFVGEGGAALTFRSAFYPGASVDAELLPSGAELGALTIGGFLSADVGFDSLATEDESIPILHLEGAGGVSLRLPTPTDLRVRVGARHARFTLEANDFLPSIAQTFFTAGLHASYSFGSARLDGGLDVIPYGFHGADRRLFGESSRMLGFAGGLALRFELIDTLDGTLGYRFRAMQSRFAGEGTLEFRDTVGFELVHGPRLGVTLRY